MILVGDVGGTNARMAVFEQDKCIREKTFQCASYESLESIIEEFSDEKEIIEVATFGVAGPVKDQTCKTTNIPWIVSAKKLQNLLKIEKVYLINDLEANAYGLEMLSSKDFFVIQEGKKQRGNRAVISAGTGLGEACVFEKDGAYFPFPTEGGHVDFAPRNDLEKGLLNFLQKKYKHVSYERVLSGPGIKDIYLFLQENSPQEKSTLSLDGHHVQKEISQAAINKTDKIAQETMKLFISIYGAEVGNAALKFFSSGGIYLGGGIAPAVVELFKEDTFISAFIEKGRLSTILQDMPVKIIMNDKTALLGTYHFAKRKL